MRRWGGELHGELELAGAMADGGRGKQARHEASTPINRTQGLTIAREPVFTFRRPPLLQRARARCGAAIPAPHCQIQPPHTLPRCSVVLRSSKPDAQNHQSPLAGIDRALPPPLAADELLPVRPDLDS